MTPATAKSENASVKWQSVRWRTLPVVELDGDLVRMARPGLGYTEEYLYRAERVLEALGRYPPFRMLVPDSAAPAVIFDPGDDDAACVAIAPRKIGDMGPEERSWRERAGLQEWRLGFYDPAHVMALTKWKVRPHVD